MDVDHTQSDINAADALLWLAEMGADEIIGEVAVNRFAASHVVAKPQAQVEAPQRAATLPDQSAAEALVQALACDSIEALIQAQNYFDANPLRKSATQLSFIEGLYAAPLLIIGDKPRNEEDRSGLVFAGKARILLGAMLAAIDLKIEDVAMMNLVAWRPPGNRAPSESEISLSLPFARRAIQLIKPKLILSFGALGGQHLAAGDASIVRQRGKWLTCEATPMLATYHPEELLKYPAQKKLAWRDLLNFQQKWNNVK